MNSDAQYEQAHDRLQSGSASEHPLALHCLLLLLLHVLVTKLGLSLLWWEVLLEWLLRLQFIGSCVT